MRRLHIFVAVDNTTTTIKLNRLLDSLDTAALRHHLELYSFGKLKEEVENELVTWAKESKLQLYIFNDSSQLETVLKKSIWQYAVLLRWSDIIYSDAIDKLSVAITKDPVDMVFDMGEDWLRQSEKNEFAIFHQSSKSKLNDFRKCSKNETIFVPRLVLLSQKYIRSQNRLPIIFSNLQSANEDMICYLRSVQQENCQLATVKFLRCPLFIKDPCSYDNIFVKYPELFQDIVIVPNEQYLDVFISKKEKDRCLQEHVYKPWFDHTLVEANTLFEEEKWDEALKLYLSLKGDDMVVINIRKADCYWRLKQWHIALRILHSIAEPTLDALRIMVAIYAETSDDVHELQCLRTLVKYLNDDLAKLILNKDDADNDDELEDAAKKEEIEKEIIELESEIKRNEAKIRIIQTFLERETLRVIGEVVPKSELWAETNIVTFNHVWLKWSESNSDDDIKWHSTTFENEPELIEDSLEVTHPDWCSRSYPPGFKEETPSLLVDDLPDPVDPDPIPLCTHRPVQELESSVATEPDDDAQMKNETTSPGVVNHLMIADGRTASELEAFLFVQDGSTTPTKINMLSIATDPGPMWVPAGCDVVQAIDGTELDWTSSLSQIFFTKENLLVTLNKDECHHFMTDKVGTILSHRQLLYTWLSQKENADQEWFCVLQDNIRGLRHFKQRLNSLVQSVTHVAASTAPNLGVVFLNKTKTDATRLCFGVERIDDTQARCEALGYIIRRVAAQKFLVNSVGITHAHIGAWFCQNLVCAQANPPLVWRRRLSIERDSWIIKDARPLLVIYGLFQSFMKPIFAELLHMFRIRFYLSFGGEDAKLGSHEVKALKDFNEESVNEAHALLLLDTADVILHHPLILPTVLWFTGNDILLKRSKMLLWYASKNKSPIHRVLVNHHSQAEFLHKNYFIDASIFTLVPLLPWIIRNSDDCNKIKGRFLCRYSNDSFDCFISLLNELQASEIQCEAVVIGTQIDHKHLSYARKSRGKVQFFGLLSENEMLDELFESDYFWTYTEPVQSLDIALVELAQYCGCITISNCGTNVLNPEDNDSVKEILTDNDKKTNLRNMCLKFRDDTIKQNVAEYWRQSLYKARDKSVTN